MENGKKLTDNEVRDFYDLMEARDRQELAAVISCNQKTERFGLVLSEEKAGELVQARNTSLKKHRRVEFGKGILEELIFAFCDSEYISQERYAETLMQLQEVFYEFKNESGDKLTDEELITFMREQFDTVCEGDVEYLAGTCLTVFSSAVRAGYRGYEKTGGHNEYEKFDEVKRWDKDLYMEVLKELFWG